VSEATALARRALAQVGLRPDRLRSVGDSFNAVVRADTGERSYTVRVGPRTRIHPDGAEEAEAAWLEAIHRDHVAEAPRMVRGEDGAVVRHVGIEPGDTRVVTILHWLDGRRPAEPLAVGVARRMGTSMARLHEHGGSLVPGGPVPIADRTLYWEVPPRLGELAASHGSLFTDALLVADSTIARLWESSEEPPRLLHGDFRPANLLAGRSGSLRIIDFQDLCLGLPVQDIAITASALLARSHGRVLFEAFRGGYAEVRRWPTVDGPALEALIVGRRLHQLNLGLALRRPGLDSMIDRVATEVRAFLAAGGPETGA
jgi:Ser/Thr protein kinase RdoA (MazF antagonist)